MKNMSNNEAQAVINFMIDEHNTESYEDFSELCLRMSEAAEAMSMLGSEFDHVEMNNLYVLKDIMLTASKLWRNCDPYFRSVE